MTGFIVYGLVVVVAALSYSAAVVARSDPPNDPYYASSSAWGQGFKDQWGLHAIGFGGDRSAWDIEDGSSNPVIVAVIDSGVDFTHPDFPNERVWRNLAETIDGKDEDGNGYVDDVVGYDFVDRDNNPTDWVGHGTHVAGIILARTNNGAGIAGVNPGAVIMPLRALNHVIRGRGAATTEAIYYAVANGARIINLSLGSAELTRMEREAVQYAVDNNVLVVVAAGNEGIDTAKFGMAVMDEVLTVGASTPDGKRANFSNWGPALDIIAPGTDILSLRARDTDMAATIRLENYEPGANIVGEDYYRVDGTSFAAPFVTGVASLLLAANPDLTAAQVRRMLLHSARDVEQPGIDNFAGFGLLDARAALKADPEYFVESAITGVAAVQRGGSVFVQVQGTATADKFKRARIELARASAPADWKTVVKRIKRPVTHDVLGEIKASEFQGAKAWILRVITEHRNGSEREARFDLTLN